MKQYLEKVGEIRSSMLIPPRDSQEEKFLDRLPQDSRRHYSESIDNLTRAVSESQSNEDWHIIKDRMSSDNFMTLKSKHPYGTAVYIIAFQNPEGNTEVGFSMRKPKPIQWIEQAKTRAIEQEKEDSGSQVNSNSKSKDVTTVDRLEHREIEHNHKPTKHKDKPKNRTNKETEHRTDSSSGSTSRIESDIQKENLIILLSARISNVLHATRKRDDFRQIIDYYDELEDVLKNIYDMESLMDNEHRLPHKLNSEDIDTIKQKSFIIEEEESVTDEETGESKDQDFSVFNLNQ